MELYIGSQHQPRTTHNMTYKHGSHRCHRNQHRYLLQSQRMEAQPHVAELFLKSFASQLHPSGQLRL